MAVPFYLHACQYCAYVIAMIANFLLLHLIKVMYIQGSGMLFYVDSLLKYHENEGLGIAIVYCGCLALCISMLTTHFIFRYIAVCRSQHLKFFKGNNIFSLFVPPFTLFIIWSISMYVNYRPIQLKKDFFQKIVKELYEEDMDKIAFIAPLYYTHQVDGRLLLRYTDLFGALLSCPIMSTCFTTCLFCAFKTYKKLHDASVQMSKKTRSLSKQLFWSLALQTLLPCFTQYIPVGLVFILPIFEIEVGKYINIVGVTCSLYPASDPLIAIFIIDRFRNYVLRKETKSSMKVSKISQTYKSYGDTSNG